VVFKSIFERPQESFAGYPSLIRLYVHGLVCSAEHDRGCYKCRDLRLDFVAQPCFFQLDYPIVEQVLLLFEDQLVRVSEELLKRQLRGVLAVDFVKSSGEDVPGRIEIDIVFGETLYNAARQWQTLQRIIT